MTHKKINKYLIKSSNIYYKIVPNRTRTCDLTVNSRALYQLSYEDLNKNTGNPFRSSDLGVMSPARFLCAMPVISFAPVP